MIHHRSQEFSEILASMLVGMREVFGTEHDVLPIHTTGRGAMEASIANLFVPGDEVVACCNGKFGEMWAGIAEVYGLVVRRISVEWGRSIDPGEVRSALETHAAARAVTMVHSDSSTGVLNDVAGICEVARAQNRLVLVDGISSIGGVRFSFDEWGVDIGVTASQKCLMSSPGLAFVAVSERGWEAIERAGLPRRYWDFRPVRESLAKSSPDTPGTTPVHLVMQVEAALQMIAEEGLSQVFSRHSQMSSAAVERIQSLGLGLQCGGLDRYSPVVTGVQAPPDVAAEAIRRNLRRRGFLTAAGLGKYEGTAFRIGHLGDIRPSDLERALDALEEVLVELRS